ncbi:conserved hypothetical protein [Trichinella spiralis]|uniref:hypothetical protein n=1 Tax=Trichinella spiralis TaxID=6334 RepID=UPI0001EFCE3F|nr:conserved hypothetical protein [Trichinella spiralis]
MKFVLLDSTKNVVHDVFSSCGLSFVNFVKQIREFSVARYSAHFDAKLRSILKFGQNWRNKSVDLRVFGRAMIITAMLTKAPIVFLVKKLSVLRFLPFPHQRPTKRFTISAASIGTSWHGCLPTYFSPAEGYDVCMVCIDGSTSSAH